jgi:hypothetical protein
MSTLQENPKHNQPPAESGGCLFSPRVSLNYMRVIDSLGPSTIQPLTASSQLPASLKQEIQIVFAEIHEDAVCRPYLDKGFIDHFVAI